MARGLGGRSGRRRGLVLGACAALAVGALWTGCSIEKNYKTLSFFFDGVPDPSAPKKLAGIPLAAQEDIRQSPTYSAHPPFVQGKCVECHSERFQLSSADASLCMKCHSDQLTKHERMHGAVVGMACLWCHTPHESAYAHLFKANDRTVCTQCHAKGVLNTERVEAHADPKRGCLECHYGHGGDAQYFLKPAGERPALPATK